MDSPVGEPTSTSNNISSPHQSALVQGDHVQVDAYQTSHGRNPDPLRRHPDQDEADANANEDTAPDAMAFVDGVGSIRQPSPTPMDPHSELNPSSPGLDEPDSVATADHSTPVGPPSPSWPRAPAESHPTLDLLDMNQTPMSRSCPPTPSKIPLHPSSPSPRSKASGAILQNGHVLSPLQSNNICFDSSGSSRAPKDDDHLDRLEHSTLRTESTSYDGHGTSPDRSPTSDYLSLDNPIRYENARRFPPRLPTAPPFSATHKRSDATRRIQSWIVRRKATTSATPGPGSSQEGISDGGDAISSLEASFFSDDSVDSDVEDLWRQLNERRIKVKGMKEQMKKKRTELRSLRSRTYAADNIFMGNIRPILVDRGTLHQASMGRVEKQFAEMQRFRTEYQDVETSYEELEDAVGREEAYLDRVEVRFYSLLGSGGNGSGPALVSKTRNDLFNPDNVPHELRGIYSQKPLEDLDPLFVKLTLAVANLRNEREELNTLLNVKRQCDSEVEVKLRVGQRIPKELTDFLADFPSREASKRNEVCRSEREVNRFKKLCEDKEVMGKHLSVQMSIILYPEYHHEDIHLGDETSILSNHSTLAHPVFSELLSRPDHLLAANGPLTPAKALDEATKLPDDSPEKEPRIRHARKEVFIDELLHDHNEDSSTAERINRWLLYTLRTSPSAVVMLYLTFLSYLSVKNVSRWQCDVLRYWYKDDTMATVDRYRAFDEHSEYYSRVGTPPRSRAASDGAATRGVSDNHKRVRSGNPVTL